MIALEQLEFPTVPADIAAVALDALREGRVEAVDTLLAPLLPSVPTTKYVSGNVSGNGASLAHLDPFQRAHQSHETGCYNVRWVGLVLRDEEARADPERRDRVDAGRWSDDDPRVSTILRRLRRMELIDV